MSRETKIIRSGEQPTMLLLPKSKLIVLDAEGGPNEYTVDKGTIVIGTGDTADLKLKDETVSRAHAEISKTKDGYLLKDLGSTNGTFVSGLKVKEAFLAAGAIIKIGKTRIKFTPLDEQVEIYPSKKSSFGEITGRS